ncbi:hypothetical protein [Metabacillus fastidiosus]|uniref:hypothetical protein n=1 Tax=Metabacillus fastidiosus TaxID=1458 RepID=UPI003D2B25F4
MKLTFIAFTVERDTLLYVMDKEARPLQKKIKEFSKQKRKLHSMKMKYMKPLTITIRSNQASKS